MTNEEKSFEKYYLDGYNVKLYPNGKNNFLIGFNKYLKKESKNIEKYFDDATKNFDEDDNYTNTLDSIIFPNTLLDYIIEEIISPQLNMTYNEIVDIDGDILMFVYNGYEPIEVGKIFKMMKKSNPFLKNLVDKAENLDIGSIDLNESFNFNSLLNESNNSFNKLFEGKNFDKSKIKISTDKKDYYHNVIFKGVIKYGKYNITIGKAINYGKTCPFLTVGKYDIDTVIDIFDEDFVLNIDDFHENDEDILDYLSQIDEDDNEELAEILNEIINNLGIYLEQIEKNSEKFFK